MSIEVTLVSGEPETYIAEFAIGTDSFDVAIGAFDTAANEYRLNAEGRTSNWPTYVGNLHWLKPRPSLPSESMAKELSRRSVAAQGISHMLLEHTGFPGGDIPVVIAEDADVHFGSLILGFGLMAARFNGRKRQSLVYDLMSHVGLCTPVPFDAYSAGQKSDKLNKAHLISPSLRGCLGPV